MVKWTIAFAVSLLMSFVTWQLFEYVQDYKFSTAYIGGGIASLVAAVVFSKFR